MPCEEQTGEGDPRFASARPSLRDLFLGTRNKRETGREKAHVTCAIHRYTLNEIGEHFGPHYSMVSKMLRRERRGNLHIKI